MERAFLDMAIWSYHVGTVIAEHGWTRVISRVWGNGLFEMPGGIVGHLSRTPARVGTAEQTAKPRSWGSGGQTVVNENTHLRRVAIGRQLNPFCSAQ